MKKRLTTLIIAACLAAPLGVAQADPASYADQEAEEAALKAEWQTKYRNLVRQVEQTRAQLEEDQRFYTKGKQRGRLKGGVRQEVVARIDEGEKKLAQLEKELADFPDTARRAGVPPGWLREVGMQ